MVSDRLGTASEISSGRIGVVAFRYHWNTSRQDEAAQVGRPLVRHRAPRWPRFAVVAKPFGIDPRGRSALTEPCRTDPRVGWTLTEPCRTDPRGRSRTVRTVPDRLLGSIANGSNRAEPTLGVDPERFGGLEGGFAPAFAVVGGRRRGDGHVRRCRRPALLEPL
jgi:hypothetical protein